MASKIAQKHAKSTIKSAPKPAQKLESSADSSLDFGTENEVKNMDLATKEKKPTKESNQAKEEKDLKKDFGISTKENLAKESSKKASQNPAKPAKTLTKEAIKELNQKSVDSAKSQNQIYANLHENLRANHANTAHLHDDFLHANLPHLQKGEKPQRVFFANRKEAFDKLYDMFINQHIDSKQNLILATSFDGLFFAHSLAHELDSKLDLLFSAPIFAPMNDECEIASVSENMDIVLNEELIDSFDITLDYVYGEARRTYEEVLLPRIYKFRKGGTLSDLSQKDVFLIDQGVESGITMSLAIKTCIQKKAKSIFVLTPIIARDVAELLNAHCDMLISVARIDYFVSTAHYYENLESLSEEEVLKIMSAHTKTDKAEKIENPAKI